MPAAFDDRTDILDRAFVDRSARSEVGVERHRAGLRGVVMDVDRLKAMLAVNKLLRGCANTALIDALLQRGVHVHFLGGETLIAEGDATDDIYLIVRGEVAIRQKNNSVASRAAGEFVGEMAVLEPGQPRSATVQAAGPVDTLRLSAMDFESLASEFPTVYRNLARTLSEKLRQRSQHVRPRGEIPRIFVGSSTEGLPDARALCDALRREAATERLEVVVTLWSDDDSFRPSLTTIESLAEIAKHYDFAVLLFTPDDSVTVRGEHFLTSRDNLFFEFGLFLGALGRERTFALEREAPKHRWRFWKTNKLRRPTDFAGITLLRYQELDGFGTAPTRVLREVREHGPR